MASFRATGDNILVERFEAQEMVTKGGIVLPGSTTHSSQPAFGKVVNVGNGGYDRTGIWREPECRPGDIVAFRPLAGWEPIRVSYKEYFIGKVADVLGVYDPDGSMPEQSAPEPAGAQA